MAVDRNVTWKEYNGTDYDNLYPTTKDSNVLLSAESKEKLGITGDGATISDMVISLTGSDYGALRVGDTLTTIRTDMGSKWLLCNGASIYQNQYPELYNLLPPVDYTQSASWDTVKLSTPASGYNARRSWYENGYWVLHSAFKPSTTTIDVYQYLYYTQDPLAINYVQDSTWNKNYDITDMVYFNGQYIALRSTVISNVHYAYLYTKNDITSSDAWAENRLFNTSATIYVNRMLVYHNKLFVYYVAPYTQYFPVYAGSTINAMADISGQNIIGSLGVANDTLYGIGCSGSNYSIVKYNEELNAFDTVQDITDLIKQYLTGSVSLNSAYFYYINGTYWCIFNNYSVNVADDRLIVFLTSEDGSTWTVKAKSSSAGTGAMNPVFAYANGWFFHGGGSYGVSIQKLENITGDNVSWLSTPIQSGTQQIVSADNYSITYKGNTVYNMKGGKVLPTISVADTYTYIKAKT